MAGTGLNVTLDTGELRFRRRAALMTQQQLATTAGVSIQTILRLEGGQPNEGTRGVRMETAERLAKALGMEVRELLVLDKVPV